MADCLEYGYSFRVNRVTRTVKLDGTQSVGSNVTRRKNIAIEL